MRRGAICAVLAFTALFSGFTSVASACRGANRTPAQQSVEDARWAVICLINHQRARHHRDSVRGVATLGNAAQGHSVAMVTQDFFSHGGDGTPISRADSAGYTGGHKVTVGETLGWGGGQMGTPRTIVRSWMGSASHREVILMRRFRQIGIGVAIGSPVGADHPDTATYTADLGRR